MKKTLIFFMLILTLVLIQTSPNYVLASPNTPQKIRVIFNQTRVYSTNDLSSITTLEELEAVTLQDVFLHDVFNVKSDSGDYYEIWLTPTISGYIQKIAVIDNDISSPTVFLQTNGYALTQSYVYEKINNVYYQLNTITISQNQRIRILNGYDKSQEYTFVSFTNSNSIDSYYVKTNNIKPDGLDMSILMAISLIIISISIGGILFKIINKKAKINYSLQKIK